MDKDDIKIMWGHRFSRIFRTYKGVFPNKFKIIQKDLASTLKISENTITQWKQGKLDIKLTSIYEVVNYIKERFPESTPMQLLFPELVNSEIEQVKTKFNKTIDELENKNNVIRNKNKKYCKVMLELQKVCQNADDDVINYFQSNLPKDIFETFFKMKV